jgi:two-component system OmpR family sensor kinase
MSGEARRLLTSLREGIQRGRALVEQLLSYARIQSPGRPASPICLRGAIRDVLQDLMPLAESKEIDVGIKSDGSAWIMADPAEVQVIVRNLLANAIIYTPKAGQVDAWVETMAEVSVLHVEDTGPGIPQVEHLRVLDPFYRILGTEQVGSGLGLAIVKVAVDRLGGQISFSSSSIGPSGLRVTVEFPAASAEESRIA